MRTPESLIRPMSLSLVVCCAHGVDALRPRCAPGWRSAARARTIVMTIAAAIRMTTHAEHEPDGPSGQAAPHISLLPHL